MLKMAPYHIWSKTHLQIFYFCVYDINWIMQGLSPGNIGNRDGVMGARINTPYLNKKHEILCYYNEVIKGIWKIGSYKGYTGLDFITIKYNPQNNPQDNPIVYIYYTHTLQQVKTFCW